MSTLAIEPRRNADEEEIFRLYRDVFGGDMEQASRRRWRWQYLENPHGLPSGPAIWVARDGERILGQYASMPVRLWWAGREVRASWGMDVFLRPEARGRGVGARLFDAWSDSVDVALGLGLTPSSYGLFRKLGYRDVGPVPFYQRVLDPRAVAAYRLGPTLGRPAGTLAAGALRLLAPARGLAHTGVAVGIVDGFGEEYDALWERLRDAYAMCVRRDRTYLEWKYTRCPHRRYLIREARRGAALAGYAVSRDEDYAGLRLGWLIDVFAHPDDHAAKDALLGATLDGFREAGVARAQAFSLNAALAGDLKRRGFVPRPSPMQFCVRARAGAEAAFADPRRWHVVFGDSDMDR